jgi:hypothetical protein
MSVVYRHIRLDKNEPFYIGIGKTEKRAYSKHSRNRYWNHITKNTEYKVQILFDDLSWDMAVEKEIELIQTYGRKDLGLGTLVNLTDGGEGLRNYKLSESQLQFLRENFGGEKNPMFGKKHTQQSLDKIKEVRRNQVFTEESNRKRSEKQKGIKRSPEYIEKLKQRKHSPESIEKMKNRVVSEETRKKLSESKKGNKWGVKNLKQYQTK